MSGPFSGRGYHPRYYWRSAAPLLQSCYPSKVRPEAPDHTSPYHHTPSGAPLPATARHSCLALSTLLQAEDLFQACTLQKETKAFPGALAIHRPIHASARPLIMASASFEGVRQGSTSSSRLLTSVQVRWSSEHSAHLRRPQCRVSAGMLAVVSRNGSFVAARVRLHLCPTDTSDGSPGWA